MTLQNLKAERQNDRLQYYGPNPENISSGKYVVGLQRFSDMFAEALHLHKEHWEEVETLYLSEKDLRLDYKSIIASERAGQVAFFTLRTQTRELVGNLGFYLFKDTHDGSMQASEDVFFISKAHRKGLLAVAFLRYAENTLRSLGIEYVAMTSKHPCGGPCMEPLFNRLGYKPIALTYLKRLE